MPLRLSLCKNFSATLITVAVCLFNVSVYAAEADNNDGSHKVHPIDETKKAAKAVGHGVKKTAKAIGHGVKKGALAVGHGAKEVTQKVGHAFRDGAHEVTDKKD